MGRLKKADVERLLDDYDGDPVGALTAALRVVLDSEGDFAALVVAAGLPPERRSALLAHEPRSLDELLVDLNELRTLPR